MRLLIAEDDRALSMFLRRGLELNGHHVHVVSDGAQAVEAFRSEFPDLTILDLNLPVMDGETALRAMRRIDSDLPILILTGRQQVDTRIRCLDGGADDLMLKPFSLFELQARCRALTRRKKDAHLVLRTGDLELSRLDHSVRHSGKTITLTNKEFALLEYLMLNRGRCIPRTELLQTVWNGDSNQTTNIVDVYVNYLRRKLEDPRSSGLICTVRGQGYMIPCETGIPGSSAIDSTSSTTSQPIATDTPSIPKTLTSGDAQWQPQQL